MAKILFAFFMTWFACFGGYLFLRDSATATKYTILKGLILGGLTAMMAYGILFLVVAIF